MSDHERGEDCRDYGHSAHLEDGEVVWTPHPPANELERAHAEERLRHADARNRAAARERVLSGEVELTAEEREAFLAATDVPDEGRGERGTDEKESGEAGGEGSGG